MVKPHGLFNKTLNANITDMFTIEQLQNVTTNAYGFVTTNVDVDSCQVFCPTVYTAEAGYVVQALRMNHKWAFIVFGADSSNNKLFPVKNFTCGIAYIKRS